MGGGASQFVQRIGPQRGWKRSDHEVVRMLMPVYYTKEPVTSIDVANARIAWGMILDDTSPAFKQYKAENAFCSSSSCIMFFYDAFYERLFNVHPACKPLFHSGMKAQGKLLVRIVNMALAIIDDRAEFERSMQQLAANHYEKGIKAVEYGIMGETLFWALKKALGPSVYDTAAHSIWVRIYSEMLTIIVPKVVEFELKNGELDGGRPSHIECFVDSPAMTDRASLNSVAVDTAVTQRGGQKSLRTYARYETTTA